MFVFSSSNFCYFGRLKMPWFVFQIQIDSMRPYRNCEISICLWLTNVKPKCWSKFLGSLWTWHKVFNLFHTFFFFCIVKILGFFFFFFLPSNVWFQGKVRNENVTELGVVTSSSRALQSFPRDFCVLCSVVKTASHVFSTTDTASFF